MQSTTLGFAQCIRIVFGGSQVQALRQLGGRRNVNSGRTTTSCRHKGLQLSGNPILLQTPTRYYSQRGTGGADGASTIPRTEGGEEGPVTTPSQSDPPSPTTVQNRTTSSPSPAQEELPSTNESRRTRLSRHFSQLMDNVQSNIFVASQRLNDLTGYSGIERLKRSIEKQESLVSDTRRTVKTARSAYSTAVATRSTTQREVNDLLQRKHNWTAADLERFTGLYRSDHANEQAEQKAQDELARCERDAEEAGNALAKSILARYHEEQIWSDKIRQMSTWGTWGLMGVNVLLFLVFQVAVEPWRRKRLVKGFEDKVMKAMQQRGDMPESHPRDELRRLDPDSDYDHDLSSSSPPSPTTTTTTPNLLPSSSSSSSSSSFATLLLSLFQTPPLLLTLVIRPSPSSSSSSSSSTSPHDLLSDSQTLSLTHRQTTTLIVQAAAAGGVVVAGLVLVAGLAFGLRLT